MGWMDDAGITGPGAATPAADVDLGPAARRARAGRPAEPTAKSDDELGIDEGVKFANPGNSPGRRQGEPVPPGTPVVGGVPLQPGVTDSPLAQDTIAQGIVGGAMAAPLAALAGAGAVAAGATAGASTVTGAVAGAEQAAMTGQNPVVGAVVGGAIPGLSAAGKTLAPWGQAAARRVSERVVTEWGQAATGAGKSKVQAGLIRIDPEKVAATLEANGISLRGQSAAEAQAAQRAALARTGKELGAARDVVDAADPARKTVGDAMKAVEAKIEAMRKGPAANVPLADVMHGWSKDYLQAQGGAPGAPVSVSDLSKTISALEEKGYGGMGAKLPPGDAKKAARIIAGALDDVMDEHIGTVAAKNPAAAQAAKEIAAKTAEFRVLKTVQPIIDNRVPAERFGQTFAQKMEAAGHAPITMTQMGAKALSLVPRGAARVNAAADRAIARLFAAKAAGQVTPDLLQAAEQAGVATPMLQFFARPAEQRR